MKMIGIIPARYQSSRFPGKPLADICGKPMIWWVYNQVIKTPELDEVYVATDDTRIADSCKEHSIKYIMTSNSHSTSTQRVYEVACKIKADLYVCINGDEPLIEPSTISKIIPADIKDFYVANLMTPIKRAAEVVDSTNIKVVTDCENNALFMSRSPIPFPKSSIDYQYYKHVGVLAYCFDALKFFSITSKGKNENVEDINELRFIEHGKKLRMISVEADTLSVDTPKDLDIIISIISRSREGAVL